MKALKIRRNGASVDVVGPSLAFETINPTRRRQYRPHEDA